MASHIITIFIHPRATLVFVKESPSFPPFQMFSCVDVGLICTLYLHLYLYESGFPGRTVFKNFLKGWRYQCVPSCLVCTGGSSQTKRSSYLPTWLVCSVSASSAVLSLINSLSPLHSSLNLTFPIKKESSSCPSAYVPDTRQCFGMEASQSHVFYNLVLRFLSKHVSCQQPLKPFWSLSKFNHEHYVDVCFPFPTLFLDAFREDKERMWSLWRLVPRILSFLRCKHFFLHLD